MPDPLLVVLRGSGTVADVRRTIAALEAHTPGVEVISVESQPGIDERRPMVYVVGDAKAHDAQIWNLLRQAPEADVVLLETGRAVGPGWRETLQSAAYEDGVIATASAVPAEVLGVPPTGADGSPGSTARSSGSAAVGAPVWGCVYVRRDALLAALAARAEPLRYETQRSVEEVLLLPGLVHVLASTVVHAPPAGPSGAEAFVTPSVRRVIAKLEAEVEPLRVTVDLRCCEHPFSGTQVHALNLVTALSRVSDLRLSVLLPEYVHRSVRGHVAALPGSITRLRADDQELLTAHVFHRPYQLFLAEEIKGVVSHGIRLVVTHQDMILDRTPAYFRSNDYWRGYTAATALGFIAADEVAFFSEHARKEAIRDGLVDPAKTSVVPPGTNHLDGGSDGAVRPERLPESVAPDGAGFILVLGHSYFHKNRVFALRVAEELRREYGWDGGVAFAGTKPSHGSSVTHEKEFLARHPELQARFVDLGRVDDEEQRWLYRHAALVVYPTLYEGFGLIPFEAAAVGTPCVYSNRSSVADYLPPEGALLDVADVATTARQLWPVLQGADAGEAIVRAIRSAGADLTWDRAAASYASIYRRAMERPVGLALTLGADVIVGARSQLAEDDTELRLLLLSRRVPVFRLLMRGMFGLLIALIRTVRRG